MWEELNRPRPTDGSKPAPPPPPVPLLEPERVDSAKDPFHLLLAGAVAFVVVVGLAMMIVGGGGGGGSAAVTPTSEVGREAVAQPPQPLPLETEQVPETVATTTPTEPGIPTDLLDSEQSRVFRLYLTSFGRPPDPDGFEFWTSQVRDGVSLLSIAENFAGSDEFKSRLGPDAGDTELVGMLYQNVLGRPGDAEGLQFWSDRRAGGMTIEELLVAFSESAESINATGTRP